MFNRVNAFLEAIDKKTEEMADAADEDDIARAVQQQQQQQQHFQQHEQRLRSSRPSSAASSTYHGGGGSSSSAGLAMPVTGLHGLSSAPSLNLRSHAAAGAASVAASSSPPLRSPLPPPPPPPPSTPPQTHGGAADPYAALPLAPLSLPTKLPSFRPPTNANRGNNKSYNNTNSNINDNGGFAAADNAGSPRGVSATPEDISAFTHAADEAASASPLAAETAEEGLRARCTALESDKLHWQQEAAAQKAQCAAARDEVWKATQEARSCRTAQRDAERALAAYKETSQRLLDEAQQELRRAQNASAAAAATSKGVEGDGGDHPGVLSAAQQDELAAAREVHTKLELLQAEHAALLAEVDRAQEESAKAAAELQRVQTRCRTAEAQVDALQLEVHAARESLEGEAAAHADTRRALRALQAQRDTQQQQQQQYRHGAGPDGNSLLSAELSIHDALADGEAASSASADVAQLQRDLREARQRHQMALLQVSNKQTLLDSAEREVADLKARYNELARQFDDAQVEVAAGFRSPAMPPSHLSGNAAGGSANAFADRAHMNATGSGSSAVGAGGVGSSSTGSGGMAMLSTQEALKRNPAMVRFTRQYGTAGRTVVSVLSAVDVAALRLGRVLSQARWVWRVVLMGYIGLLQLWVVLLVLVNLVSESDAAS